MPKLVDDLQTVVARLLETDELVAQQQQISKELALEEQALQKARAEKEKLTEALKQLRAEVELEKRNLAHWRDEIAKLRATLDVRAESGLLKEGAI